MCGGDAAAYARAEPVIAAYARACRLMGPAGAGQLTKMVNQICIAGLLQGLSEGLAFAQKAGLDGEAVLDVISKGAAGSWQMENRGKTMLADKFDFGFAVDWMRKDLGICLAEANANGAALPATALIDQFYKDVQAHGRRPLGHLEPDPAPAVTALAFSRAPKIAPSILSADFARLGEEVRGDRGRRRRLGACRRDGRAFRAEHHHRARTWWRRSGRTCTTLMDVHLMIAPADPFLEAFVHGRRRHRHHPRRGRRRTSTAASPASATSARKAGVSLTPSTPPAAVEYVLDKCDLVLVMTVNPGFGGQSLPARAARRRSARSAAMIGDRPIWLEVDGGITARDRAALPRGRRRRLRRRLRRLPRRRRRPTPPTSPRSGRRDRRQSRSRTRRRLRPAGRRSSRNARGMSQSASPTWRSRS